MNLFTGTSHDVNPSVLTQKRGKRELLMVGVSRGVLKLFERSRIASWVRGFVSGLLPRSHDDLARLMQAGWPMSMLRDVTIGRSKSAVYSNFGPPRAGASLGGIRVARRKCDYWNADHWYFVADAKRGIALVVTFEDAKVRQAEFFDMVAVLAKA